MSRPVLISHEELGYVAEDVISGVASQGKTLDEAMQNLREAIDLYYDGNIPKEIDQYYMTSMELA